MDVSIIIVNYNTCTLTRNCLKSVFEQTKDIDFEVIVSDNGSKDGSIEMIKTEFPQVILVENNANLGFGAANNRGLKIAKGKYIFYLNSDTVLLNNAVKYFYNYWENSPEKDIIGALGGNLLDEQNNVIHSFDKFLHPWEEIWLFIKKMLSIRVKLFCDLLKINYQKFRKEKIKYFEQKGEVDFIIGADLFVKNNESAFYDERYFLYYEETDLQYHLMKKGLKRIIISEPKTIHLCGQSGESSNKENYVSFGKIQFDLSRIKFIKYNISKFCAGILKVLLYIHWMTPYFVAKTKKYRKEIWKI